MTKKQFYFLRLAVVILLCAVFSAAINLRNYALFIVALIVGGSAMWYLRRQVQGVLADERDYAVAGNAARYAITAYAVVVMLVALPLLFWPGDNGQNSLLASALCYSVCLLMIIYSLIYRFLNRSLLTLSQRLGLWALTALMSAFLLVFALRFLAGPEDTWLCQNGQWVKHGQPAAPQPSAQCQ